MIHSIPRFSEFNDFHQAAQGAVRATFSDIHVYRFSELGQNVIDEMPLFTTDFYQIGLMRKGNFSMNVFEKEYKLYGLHAVVLFKPGQMISFKSDPEWDGYIVLFKESFITIRQGNTIALQDFPILSPSTESFTLIKPYYYERLMPLYEKLIYEHQNLKHDSFRLMEHYVHALFFEVNRLFSNPAQRSFSSREASINAAFVKLVQEEITKTKSVNDYADMLNVTPKYLIKAISEHSLCTPKEYINQKILSKAKTLLKFSDMSVQEIAQELNFKDASHFSNFFRKWENASPMSFRKNFLT